MRTDIFIQKRDRDGDLFVKGCNEYVPERRGGQVIDHLEQLMNNYESVYGEQPTNEELLNAVRFTRLFLAEIGEVYGGTRLSHEACNVSQCIDEGSLIKTCIAMADIPNDDWIEAKAIRIGKMIQESRRQKTQKQLDAL